jgi:hypothetical protein
LRGVLLGRLLSLLRGIALGLPAYTFLAVAALIIRLTLAVLIRGIGLIRILFLRLLISRCGTTPSPRPPVARATSAAGAAAVGLAFPTLLRSTRTATATLRTILSLAAVTISLVSITTLRSTAGAAIRAF